MRQNWAIVLVSIALALVTTGCSTVPKELTSTERPSETPIWKGNDPELCLAFSGGGIRSGAVSLGVLQGLQEHGVLTSAELMSSVSGGGYPIYGLVAAKEEDTSATLDSLLSDDSAHIRTAENTLFIDNFDAAWEASWASLWSFIIAAGKLLGPTPDLVEPTGGNYSYSQNIHDTFVGGVVPSRMRLTETAKFVQQLKLPYWIIQASASPGLTPPREDHRYKFEDAFELSPDWIGSETFLFMPGFVARLTLAESVSASAAAVDTPRTHENGYVIPDWAKVMGFGLGVGIWSYQGKAIYLSDGGFVENQALLPLLRRHCRHIVAVDAAHDPSASLGGWRKLARYMQQNGWTVTTPSFLSNSFDTSRSAPESAWELPSHVIEMQGRSPDGRTTKISILKLGISPSNEAAYPPSVASFLRIERAKWGDNPRCNYSSLGDQRPALSARCMFPQQTTVVQNFARAEFRAYRCLGHHMVEDYMRRSTAFQAQVGTPKRLVAADCVGITPEMPASDQGELGWGRRSHPAPRNSRFPMTSEQ